MRKIGFYGVILLLFLISGSMTGSGVFVPDFYTFSGGFFNDTNLDLVLNSSDTAFTTGYSSNAWDTGKYGFPVIEKEDCIPPTPRDIQVCSWSSAGNLLWYTFLGAGGNSQSEGHAVDVSPGGNLAITGWARVAWPSAKYGSPVYTHNGTDPDYNNADIAVASLSQAGVLNWHAFLGGTSHDEGVDGKVSSSGDIYITGSSGPWDTVRFGAPVHDFNGSYSWVSDCVVARLNSSGSLQWYTFLGSGMTYAYDTGYAIELSPSGDIYVAGKTSGAWETSEYGTPVQAYNGGDDIFVARLNSNGIVQWYTFLGSAVDEEAKDIVLHNGSLRVTGGSGGSWDTGKYGIPGYGHNGGSDCFIASLDPADGSLESYSFYGGSGDESGESIRFTSGNDLVFTGTADADFNTAVYGDPIKTAESTKIFVMKTESSGTSRWYTFIGGTGTNTNNGTGIEVDSNDDIFVSGYGAIAPHYFNSIDESRFGTPLQSHNGASDGLLIRLSEYLDVDAVVSGTGGTVSPGNQPVHQGGTASIVLTPAAGHEVTGILDNGISMPVANPYVIPNVGEDHLVEVTFSVETYHIRCVVTEGEGSAVLRSSPVEFGDTAYIDIQAAPGFEIASIIDNGVEMAISNPYVIPNVRMDHNIEVSFLRLSYPPALNLSGIRKSENAWILKKEYAELNIAISEHATDPLEVSKFILYRTMKGIRTELSSWTSQGSYTYTDTSIKNGEPAGYELIALTPTGEIAATTGVITI